jgi:hypothetical protein
MGPFYLLHGPAAGGAAFDLFRRMLNGSANVRLRVRVDRVFLSHGQSSVGIGQMEPSSSGLLKSTQC